MPEGLEKPLIFGLLLHQGKSGVAPASAVGAKAFLVTFWRQKVTVTWFLERTLKTT
jgi:hypothetical protein